MSVDEPVAMTREGIERLERELEQLEKMRLPEAQANVRLAREQSADLQENLEYTEAKTQLAMVQERIGGLRELLRRAQVVDERARNGAVALGSEVVLHLEDEGEDVSYRIVGSVEADPLAGQVSNRSPLGQALLGKKAGQKVRWALPGGRTSSALIRQVR